MGIAMLLAVTAAGIVACSGEVTSVDEGAADGSNSSISDATVAPMVDHTSVDGGVDVENVVDEMDVNALVDGNGAPESGPALLPDAATLPCPTTIDDAISSSDGQEIGRLSRFGAGAACGMVPQFPGTASDPTNPHLYRAYRFANATTARSCFTFTLNGATASDGDASTDSEASVAPDASTPPTPLSYMSAYSTFYPDDIASGFLGYTGGVINPPQTMSIAVPAGATIDVVVLAVDVAPAGAGPFTLSCTAQ